MESVPIEFISGDDRVRGNHDFSDVRPRLASDIADWLLRV